MDNKDILEDALKGLTPLSDMCNNLMASLPNEVKTMMPNAKRDMDAVFNSLKNGDTSKINEIQNKYADHSSVFMKKY